MQFSSLGSGSKGNATLVQSESTILLIDNGFSLKETCKRLASLKRHPEELTAILVTHEHGDHVAGVGRLARKYNIPVWLTEGTRKAAEKTLSNLTALHLFNSHETFGIDAIQIKPVTVPHDAREPSQFIFSDGEKRLGLLTDTGHITPHIVSEFYQCEALILECNHDDQMLSKSIYPQHLKQRISGKLGHLGNHQAAELLTKVDTSKLKHIIAAHLSEQNNCVDRVKTSLADALGCEKNWIGIAEQETGFAWRDCL
ncbi:MAG: MBL fold metallo-hydrolase [Gammaproteobacteria bacterium]